MIFQFSFIPLVSCIPFFLRFKEKPFLAKVAKFANYVKRYVSTVICCKNLLQRQFRSQNTWDFGLAVLHIKGIKKFLIFFQIKYRLMYLPIMEVISFGCIQIPGILLESDVVRQSGQTVDLISHLSCN